MVVIHFQAAVSLIYRQTCLSAMHGGCVFFYKVVHYRGRTSSLLLYRTSQTNCQALRIHIMADMMGDIMKLDFSF